MASLRHAAFRRVAGPAAWMRRLHSIGQTTGLTATTAAAILCAVSTRYLSSRRSELYSDFLCWTILPFLLKNAGRRGVAWSEKTSLLLDQEPRSRTSQRSIWVFAASVVIYSYWEAENGITKLLPALTPILMVAQNHLDVGSKIPSASGRGPLSILLNTTWGTTLVALFCTLSLSGWSLPDYLPSIIPAAALLAVYVALLPGTTNRPWFFPRINIDEAIVSISARVLVLLVMVASAHVTVFGLPQVDPVAVVFTGTSKAMAWLFITRTAQDTTWRIAVTVGAFAIASTRSPFSQSSEAQALSHVMTSLLALGQTIYTIPKKLPARSSLWALALVPLVPYLANVVATRDAQFSTIARGHPVEALFANAKLDFENLLQRQSQTYSAAHDEYRRRYGVEPPPGFQAWYELAASHQSPIIDDFDMIFDAISPLWELSGQEVLDGMKTAQNARGNQLWRCRFSHKSAKTKCQHRALKNDRNFGLLFDTLLGGLSDVLPDIEFLVNHLDEPAVLIPPPSVREDLDARERVSVTTMPREPIWREITKFCGPQTGRNETTADQKVETLGLPFVTDISSSKDLCRHTEYSTSHALLMKPQSFRLVEGRVPILSVGSLSTMGDLLFPSPAYIEEGFRYDPANNVEWEAKRRNLYWAGSTTGGFASDDRWRLYQRQRFVELAQNLRGQGHSYLREADGVVRREESLFLDSRLYDVAFTRILQCERKQCRDQAAYFDMKGWAHKDEALRSQLVFDIDGNGISGRYYKLLASKSTPLKQTILREWHDERLVPWLHYVSVSQGMEEVPELVAYLTLTEAGQRIAREIAEEGRKWFFRALREDDFRIYTHRLLLELARVQDPERRAGEPGVR